MAKPTNAPNARPGTADGKAAKPKKEKVARVDHPALKNDKGEAVKLANWPTDYDRKVHKPLKRSDFENEGVFYESKAVELEQRAAALRKQAEIAKRLGNQADRAKAKRLLKMQESMATLQKELSDQGIDIAGMLAALKGGDKAE